jgi:hypothetical protein
MGELVVGLQTRVVTCINKREHPNVRIMPIAKSIISTFDNNHAPEPGRCLVDGVFCITGAEVVGLSAEVDVPSVRPQCPSRVSILVTTASRNSLRGSSFPLDAMVEGETVPGLLSCGKWSQILFRSTLATRSLERHLSPFHDIGEPDYIFYVSKKIE